MKANISKCDELILKLVASCVEVNVSQRCRHVCTHIHIHKRKDRYQNGQEYILLKSRKSVSDEPAEISPLDYCIKHCYFQKTNLTLNPSVSLVV